MAQIDPALGFDPGPSPGRIALRDAAGGTISGLPTLQPGFNIPATPTGPLDSSHLLPSAMQTPLSFSSQAYPIPATSSSSTVTSGYVLPPPSATQFSTTMQVLPNKYNSSRIQLEFQTLRTKIAELEQQLQAERNNVSAIVKGACDGVVAHLCAEFEARAAVLQVRIDRLMQEKAGNGEENEEDKDREEDNNETDDDEDAVMTSEQASNHNKIKQLTTVLFQKFLKSSLKTKDDIPAFEDGPLPLVVGSKDVHQLRFQWDQTASSAHNRECISTIAAFARSNGSDYVGEVKELLEVITVQDMESRVQKKFEQVHKKFKGTNKSQKEEGGMSKKKHDNRARGKLEVRNQKRTSNQVPNDKKWIQEEKFDVAFDIAHMLDDEDFINEDGSKDKTKFLARAPEYRSEDNLFETVDSCPDPNPSAQYVMRVRGKPKDTGMAKLSFEKRARRWMVCRKWLGEHSDYDKTLYVIDNGKLWGDKTNPIEEEKKCKTLQEEKKNQRRKRKSEETVVASDEDEDEEESGRKKRKKAKKKGKR
ncbi:hypothetical protein VKT23_014070 [Stygiomarasmius scandens]|uniref:Uncharacterized protein n=1 Tax=Marasmiellus scandens TaxID=2682957 RepID=A0ABR1J3S4_9AGAR